MKVLNCKIKKKWLKISIYIFIGFLSFIIISWFLTASMGIKAVKNKHEAFLSFIYKGQKEAYKKDPNRLGKIWTTPQTGVTVRRSEFWKRKLFKEKKYPSFEEWRDFYSTENHVYYSVLCPFIIESKHYAGNTAWMQEYYFWFFGYTRRYKHDILVYID